MIGALLTLALGGFFVVLTSVTLRALRAVARRGEGWPETRARVVSMGQDYQPEIPFGRYRPLPTVTYEYPHPVTGETLRGTDLHAAGGALGPGEPVTVRVDPADPARSHTSPGQVGTVITVVTVFLVIGVVLVCLGLIRAVTALVG